MSSLFERITILVLATCFCFLFPCRDVQAFRCGDEIVGIGDSKAKVLVKCGKPTFKEKAASKKGRKKRNPSVNGGGSYTHDKGHRPGGEEKWTYNCGKSDFIYVLTFEKGVVVQEDTDGRGKGRSDCLGR